MDRNIKRLHCDLCWAFSDDLYDGRSGGYACSTCCCLARDGDWPEARGFKPALSVDRKPAEEPR
jgi:hypothetical protein